MKQKPILGFWIFSPQHKPVFVIDSDHDSVLNYQFTKSDVPVVKQLIEIVKQDRASKTFERQQISIEVVIDRTIAPSILVYKKEESLGWMFFDPRERYESEYSEEGSERQYPAIDFCRTIGEANRLTRPEFPMFDRYAETPIEKQMGRNEEESE